MRVSAVVRDLFLALLIVVGSAAGSSAQLSIFQTQMQAQLHCPNDTVVWLDFQKRRYYLPGQRLYGKGRTGVYACREEAKRNMHRRSILGWR